jgi:guanine deaminase
MSSPQHAWKVNFLNAGTPFALKGNIIWSRSAIELASVRQGYIICENGAVTGVFNNLPERFNGMEVTDYGDKIVIPGLVDLHVHAPQYTYRGLGMDLELLPWLETYAFREEANYADAAYAGRAYGDFCTALKKSATTHASVFATLHTDATVLLMDLLEETGLHVFAGKVNMDRNSPAALTQPTAEAIADTEAWLKNTRGKYKRVKPILTPRFVPTCTDALLSALGRMASEYRIPVQSHLSENKAEIAWVKQLHPDCETYAGVYDKYGLFGRGVPTVMAHCVYPEERELDLIRENGVFVAHCPGSNTNISSGIAPVRKMLERGLNIGLGTDVAGGFSLSVFRAVSDAVQVSKLYSVLVDGTAKPLTLPEAFYLATKGGGAFWGKVGSFEPGYGLSAVILDDTFNAGYDLSPEQRLERIVYLSDDSHIAAKYVDGVRIL